MCAYVDMREGGIVNACAQADTSTQHPNHPLIPLTKPKKNTTDLLVLIYNPLAHERPPTPVRFPVSHPHLRVYAR